MHGIWKSRVVTRRVALVGQHDVALSSRRARQARHVFAGVTSLFPEVVLDIDANPEHKRLNLCARALLLLRRLPCWNKHGATRTTCTCDVVSCRDVKWNLGFWMRCCQSSVPGCGDYRQIRSPGASFCKWARVQGMRNTNDDIVFWSGWHTVSRGFTRVSKVRILYMCL